MNKQIKSVMVLGIAIISLCACSQQDSKDNSNISNINNFSIDDNTIKNDSVWISKDTQENVEIESIKVEDPSTIVGELEVVNTDNTVSYYINGNNIDYNDTTYVDLKSNIDKLQLPCDTNTFINFVIKTFKTESDIVNTYYCNDNEQEVSEIEGEESTIIPLDYSLSESEEYLKVKEKHGGVPITWSLTLVDTEGKINGTIYGCEKYLMYNGSSEMHTVDMNKYNYTENTSQQSNQTQQGVEGQSENTVENNTTSNTETQE